MSSFQKVLSVLIWLCVLIVWYYFLVMLPEHNAEKLRLAEREVQMKEREQEQIQEEKEFEQQQQLSKAEQERIDQLKLDCEIKWNQIKKDYNNIFSVYFNEYAEECYVKFYDDNDVLQDIPVSEWWAWKKKEPIIPLYWIQQVLKWVNFRTLPSVNAEVIQEIDPTNYVSILWHREVDWDLWYNVEFYWKEWWIASIWLWQ